MARNPMPVALAVLALGAGACSSVKQLSADEMARSRQAALPPAPPRTAKSAEAAERRPELPFELHTWQVRTTREGGREIVVLGRGLQEARTLRIGDVAVPLTPTPDGLSASGRLPEELADDALAFVTVANAEATLPERFSRAKALGKLPRIQACRFAWGEAPVGGRGRALRFDCEVSGFEARNAPVTAFIGSTAVPNTQITERADGLTGWIPETTRLKENDPVMVDFGDGLRVLAPARFRSP